MGVLIVGKRCIDMSAGFLAREIRGQECPRSFFGPTRRFDVAQGMVNALSAFFILPSAFFSLRNVGRKIWHGKLLVSRLATILSERRMPTGAVEL